MEIGTMIAGLLASTLRSELGKRKEPVGAAETKPVDTAEAPSAPSGGSNAALREILADYRVTDISPSEFSEMIQRLYEAGALTEEQFLELSLIRRDLDRAGIAPDEKLDLVAYYLEKLTRLQEAMAESEEPDGFQSRQEALGRMEKRLEWLQKMALVQAAPAAIGLDAIV